MGSTTGDVFSPYLRADPFSKHIPDSRAGIYEMSSRTVGLFDLEEGASGHLLGTRACYELGRKPHFYAVFSGWPCPKRSPFSAFLSRF